MRIVYRAWILMAALMVLVLGGCGGFEKPEEGPASATGQGKGVPAKKPERIYSMQIGHSQPVDNPRHQMEESRWTSTLPVSWAARHLCWSRSVTEPYRDFAGGSWR